MGHLRNSLDLDTLLELRPTEIGKFCAGALDADILLEELEIDGPFALLRKRFCEFLDIGESTLTGWLKSQRVPQSAKVAYVLLVGMTMLQDEVNRLRQDAQDLKIVSDGETFQVVRFEVDETGVSIGSIVARDIPNVKTARVLAGSVKGFRMLQESRHVIEILLDTWGGEGNPSYTDYLQKFDVRIIKEIIATFEPDKWRELFGPIDSDLDDGKFLGEVERQQEARDSFEPDTTLERSSTSDDQSDAGSSRNHN